MCKLRILKDLPVTMQERESGKNYIDIQYLFEKKASEAEVLSMYINGAEPYRKKKAITKIFRRSKYIPQLEDIEENPETEAKKTHDLSLAFIHLERAMSAGLLAQESRRRRRRTSPRRERRSRRHSSPAEKA